MARERDDWIDREPAVWEGWVGGGGGWGRGGGKGEA